MNVSSSFPHENLSDFYTVKKLQHMDLLFYQNLLKESIYYANNVSDIPFPNFAKIDIEKDMYNTFSRILALFFENYPEKTRISFENINNACDIYPVLKEKLKDEVKADKIFRLRGQLSLIGILPMPYHCFILKSLIFTGNFTVKCMKHFKNEDVNIFKTILIAMLDFFKETNTRQIMHPFGSVGHQESKRKVDELCYQFEKKIAI